MPDVSELFVLITGAGDSVGRVTAEKIVQRVVDRREERRVRRWFLAPGLRRRFEQMRRQIVESLLVLRGLSRCQRRSGVEPERTEQRAPDHRELHDEQLAVEALPGSVPDALP